MFPYIEIFGREFSVYGLLAALGVIVCLIYCIAVHKRWSLPTIKTEYLIMWVCIGALVGSKILYWITIIPQMNGDISSLFTDIGSGFVFYGGFYGAVVAAVIYMHIGKIDIWEGAQMLTPCVPLFHVFGRIGCFMAGCCYGVESNTFGIMFHNSEIAPNGISLLPVQLIEAFCELILFIILDRLSKRENSGKTMFSIWLITYGCVRFVLEFFRGDEYRGFIGALSVSQAIAVISILLGIAVLTVKWSEKNTEGAVGDG